MKAWLTEQLLATSVPVAVAAFKALIGKDLRPDLPKIDRPTLVIHGDKDASAPLAITGQRLAAGIQGFNQRYAFARASLTPDGRAALQRYLTADYGFIRGDLAVNLLVFASQADRFAAEVLSPTPARR